MAVPAPASSRLLEDAPPITSVAVSFPHTVLPSYWSDGGRPGQRDSRLGNTMEICQVEAVAAIRDGDPVRDRAAGAKPLLAIARPAHPAGRVEVAPVQRLLAAGEQLRVLRLEVDRRWRKVLRGLPSHGEVRWLREDVRGSAVPRSHLGQLLDEIWPREREACVSVAPIRARVVHAGIIIRQPVLVVVVVVHEVVVGKDEQGELLQVATEVSAKLAVRDPPDFFFRVSSSATEDIRVVAEGTVRRVYVCQWPPKPLRQALSLLWWHLGRMRRLQVIRQGGQIRMLLGGGAAHFARPPPPVELVFVCPPLVLRLKEQLAAPLKGAAVRRQVGVHVFSWSRPHDQQKRKKSDGWERQCEGGMGSILLPCVFARYLYDFATVPTEVGLTQHQVMRWPRGHERRLVVGGS